MSEIGRVALFGKLNSLGYKAIEGATVSERQEIANRHTSDGTRASTVRKHFFIAGRRDRNPHFNVPVNAGAIAMSGMICCRAASPWRP